jgi:2-iminobutanoate/2-iminopropanoate deaminase
MSRSVVFSSEAPEPIGPYSQAVLAGNMLFVSGQIAIEKSTGNIHTANVEEETEQIMVNIRHILRSANMDFSNVVKCSIFLKNMADFPRVNAIYGKYFPNDPPARETVEVSALPKNVNVEISCIGMK